MDEVGPTQGPTFLAGSMKAGYLAAVDPPGLADDDLRAWSMDQKSQTANK